MNAQAASSMRTEATGSDPIVVSSSDLLRGRTEIMIDHGGECYRLRRTRQGKLILTK
ncbi:hemin uptake protein HemP [Rhodospirillaceae bacterium KN72]|uniref:Hemin uptake protein HemP n=1 Tax=Pacificispira spongiicola TaxID=2729598 RepID=A0A7Y0HI39_9PROT|nr:hemin uptake protein HemP [Pacificispira spongiicola]NMM46104.1 hemin uptake protein HemP [Pacificispira spongiicola]